MKTKLQFILHLILGLIFLISSKANSTTTINFINKEGNKKFLSDKTFPCIRTYNFHNTETLKKGFLKLYIGHRMGELSGGTKTLFGLHTANVRLGLDLGLSDKISLGFGSSSQQKIYDGYLKVNIFSQTEEMPINLSLMSNLAIKNSNLNIPADEIEFWQKMNYYSSIMISRKINQRLSAQFDISVIHKNMVFTKEDKNTIFALGASSIYTINRTFSFATEYNYLPSKQVFFTEVSSHILSLGLQIKRGPRHVFQVFISNSSHQNEFNVISETTQKLRLNNLRLSFNLPTTFKVY